MAAKKHGLGRGLDALIQRSIPERMTQQKKRSHSLQTGCPLIADPKIRFYKTGRPEPEGPLRKRIKGRSRRMKTV